ncbi:hypothetical protein GGR54DRAFT_621904 [Hypoxylon sp. NC1633]|nr:hypothetical protein GGR54DRAFT_621904 [Hypoxylon sp. NC1633]
MTTEVNASRRPSLEPIWTNYRNLGGVPKSAFRPAASPGWSPSSLSPKSLPSPSPIHPASYDGSMRRQDRALVNSLDQRARHIMSTGPLTPIDEYSPSPLVARLEKISILPPMSRGRALSIPASPSFPEGAGHRIAERSKSISAYGSTPGSHVRSPSYATDSYLSPASLRKDSTLGLRDQLRTWGHIYYGNAKTADAFVIARSLRRNSNTSPIHGTGRNFIQGISGTPPYNRLTVRAIVRPRALDRPSFLIQRNLNMDELRATIPDPPDNVIVQSPSGNLHERRRSSLSTISHDGVPGTAQAGARRPSSVRSGTLLRSGATSVDVDGLIRDAKAVPIHLKYARAFLPVIAALLVSGHVREGDVVYLPMPHAEAWPQTARYVYTGQGELTEAVRENILYLAGKV